MVRSFRHLTDPTRYDVYLAHDGCYVGRPGRIAFGVSTSQPLRLDGNLADADLAAYRLARFVRELPASAAGRCIDPGLLAPPAFPS